MKKHEESMGEKALKRLQETGFRLGQVIRCEGEFLHLRTAWHGVATSHACQWMTAALHELPSDVLSILQVVALA